MDNENILKEKQKYLREEILDKSYDIEEFTDFMSKYKENGTDLQNWEFIELKEAVKYFKNQVNENKVEKGVQNNRQSYVFNEEQNNNENPDEYLDVNLGLINNNLNNDNNCVNNILNDYLKSKENEKNNNNNVLKDEKKPKVNNKFDNINQNINEKNKMINNEIINNEQINSNNSNIINVESVISKKEPEKLNIQSVKNIQLNNESNNNNLILISNEAGNINNNLKENNINEQIQSNNINKQKELDDFEILENLNINDRVFEKINCVKQPENSLTNKDNLYINLEE